MDKRNYKNSMSKRCELQKKYYKRHGNYKVLGKYTDEYVRWLEDQILKPKQNGNILRITEPTGA